MVAGREVEEGVVAIAGREVGVEVEGRLVVEVVAAAGVAAGRVEAVVPGIGVARGAGFAAGLGAADGVVAKEEAVAAGATEEARGPEAECDTAGAGDAAFGGVSVSLRV